MPKKDRRAAQNVGELSVLLHKMDGPICRSRNGTYMAIGDMDIVTVWSGNKFPRSAVGRHFKSIHQNVELDVSAYCHKNDCRNVTQFKSKNAYGFYILPHCSMVE